MPGKSDPHVVQSPDLERFASALFQAAGVACGRHAQWGSMCVIDFAGAIVRR